MWPRADGVTLVQQTLHGRGRRPREGKISIKPFHADLGFLPSLSSGEECGRVHLEVRVAAVKVYERHILWKDKFVENGVKRMSLIWCLFFP